MIKNNARLSIVTNMGLMLLGACFWIPDWHLQAQTFTPNYDESRVPQYTLPDPLRFTNGNIVASSEAWHHKRRPEILQLFESLVYGKTPSAPITVTFQLKSKNPNAFQGKATRKEIAIQVSSQQRVLQMDLLIYLPNDRPGPYRTFLGLNFGGNHSVTTEKDISISNRWMRNKEEHGYIDHRATEHSRGIYSSRWPVESIIRRNFAVATIYYGDIDPDYHDGFQDGVHPLFYEPGQSKPDPDQWGSIGAWAWGLSRAMDYFQIDTDIDSDKVIVLGHSRLGKTALWAAAQDTRFAIAISNNSGCGGAALSRRRFGETVQRINRSFPHWFNTNFKQFNDREDALPIDQHMLIALLAPRPVLVSSAEEDRWADPRGELLSLQEADGVYRLLGTDGTGTTTTRSSRDRPYYSTLSYHIRPGKHDVTLQDWDAFMNFSEHHLKP